MFTVSIKMVVDRCLCMSVMFFAFFYASQLRIKLRTHEIFLVFSTSECLITVNTTTPYNTISK